MTFALFLQHLANALSLGSLYALIAIGYTMVYGILRLINFAHGDVFMLGAYLAFYSVATFLLPWWAAFLVAIVVTAALRRAARARRLPAAARLAPHLGDDQRHRRLVPHRERRHRRCSAAARRASPSRTS